MLLSTLLQNLLIDKYKNKWKEVVYETCNLNIDVYGNMLLQHVDKIWIHLRQTKKSSYKFENDKLLINNNTKR